MAVVCGRVEYAEKIVIALLLIFMLRGRPGSAQGGSVGWSEGEKGKEEGLGRGWEGGNKGEEQEAIDGGSERTVPRRTSAARRWEVEGRA